MTPKEYFNQDFYDLMMMKWEKEPPHWLQARGEAENRMIDQMEVEDPYKSPMEHIYNLDPPASNPRPEGETWVGRMIDQMEDPEEPIPTPYSKQVVTEAMHSLQREAVKMNNPVDNNPKTLAALGKPRLSNVPTVALYALAAAMDNGADKYGKFNWRDTSVTASVFSDAIDRHHTDFKDGFNFAEDSKIHHLAHIMACCAIQLDAILHGKFIDDRDNRYLDESILQSKVWEMQ